MMALRLLAREDRIGIEGDSLPPLLFRAEPEDGEMQVRRVLWRVARGADIADDVAALYRRSRPDSFRITVEVSVVIGEALVGIELVDREPTRGTGEKLRDPPVAGGKNGRAARGEDVDRVVAALAAALLEVVAQLLRLDALHGNR